jgi:hypothetical protein
MCVAFEPVLNPELDERFVFEPDSPENLMNDAVFLVLGVHFETVSLQVYIGLESFSGRRFPIHARRRMKKEVAIGVKRKTQPVYQLSDDPHDYSTLAPKARMSAPGFGGQGIVAAAIG